MTLQKSGQLPLAGGGMTLQIEWRHLAAKISAKWRHPPANRQYGLSRRTRRRRKWRRAPTARYSSRLRSAKLVVAAREIAPRGRAAREGRSREMTPKKWHVRGRFRSTRFARLQRSRAAMALETCVASPQSPRAERASACRAKTASGSLRAELGANPSLEHRHGRVLPRAGGTHE